MSFFLIISFHSLIVLKDLLTYIMSSSPDQVASSTSNPEAIPVFSSAPKFYNKTRGESEAVALIMASDDVCIVHNNGVVSQQLDRVYETRFVKQESCFDNDDQAVFDAVSKHLGPKHEGRPVFWQQVCCDCKQDPCLNFQHGQFIYFSPGTPQQVEKRNPVPVVPSHVTHSSRRAWPWQSSPSTSLLGRHHS